MKSDESRIDKEKGIAVNVIQKKKGTHLLSGIS
jgi:hypothetical protein